jgi:hypothetical protein
MSDKINSPSDIQNGAAATQDHGLSGHALDYMKAGRALQSGQEAIGSGVQRGAADVSGTNGMSDNHIPHVTIEESMGRSSEDHHQASRGSNGESGGKQQEGLPSLTVEHGKTEGSEQKQLRPPSGSGSSNDGKGSNETMERMHGGISSTKGSQSKGLENGKDSDSKSGDQSSPVKNGADAVGAGAVGGAAAAEASVAAVAAAGAEAVAAAVAAGAAAGAVATGEHPSKSDSPNPAAPAAPESKPKPENGSDTPKTQPDSKNKPSK